ncbi:MAG: fatty acid--CoA ligase, partial [Archaeoglobaceae archaeon]
GDLAVWDEEGYIDITDREKDVIKSGGEWISSLRLEELISTHPGVAEVCVVGIHHAKWQERPVALVVLRPEYRGKINEEDIKKYLAENFVPNKIPKWWLPDKIIFVSEIPKTGVGKYDKKVVRDVYRGIFE